jgi:hypothetical protein
MFTLPSWKTFSAVAGQGRGSDPIQSSSPPRHKSSDGASYLSTVAESPSGWLGEVREVEKGPYISGFSCSRVTSLIPQDALRFGRFPGVVRATLGRVCAEAADNNVEAGA